MSEKFGELHAHAVRARLTGDATHVHDSLNFRFLRFARGAGAARAKR